MVAGKALNLKMEVRVLPPQPLFIMKGGFVRGFHSGQFCHVQERD